MEEFEEESRLSSSLLYCLDGNEPVEEKELSFSQFNTRKRSMSFKGIGQGNKENLLVDNKYEDEDSESCSKKILVVEDDEVSVDV